MPRPPLSSADARLYEQLRQFLIKRAVSPEQMRFLLELREHLMCSSVKMDALGRRAFARGVSSTREPKAWASAQMRGDGAGGLPDPVVVRLVAEAYAERAGEPVEEVHARLSALRDAAAPAEADRKARERDVAAAAGRRQVTYAELAQVRAERDESRSEVEHTQQTLAQLQTRYNELSRLELERSQTVTALHERVEQLLDELAEVRDALAQRELTLEHSEARNRGLENYSLALRAEVDQLAADVEALHGRLDDDPSVRQDLGPDSDVVSLSSEDTPASAAPAIGFAGVAEDPAPLGSMVSGVPDATIDKMLSDIQRERFDPARAASSYGVPQKVVSHVCAVAGLAGLAGPGTRYEVLRLREKSIRELPSTVGTVHSGGLIFTIFLFASFTSSEGPSLTVLLEKAWVLLALYVAVVFGLGAMGFSSRFRSLFPGRLFVLSVSASSFATLLIPPLGLDLPVAGYAAFLMLLGMAGDCETKKLREAERFVRRLKAFHESQVSEPSAMILSRVSRIVNFEAHDAQHNDKNLAVNRDTRDEIVLKYSYYSRSEQAGVSRLPPRLGGVRDQIGGTLTLLEDCVPVRTDLTYRFLGKTRKCGTVASWLWEEGDFVRARDPLCVVYEPPAKCPRCSKPSHQHPAKLQWVRAPVDGFVVQIKVRDGESAVLDESHRQLALIAPGALVHVPPTLQLGSR